MLITALTLFFEKPLFYRAAFLLSIFCHHRRMDDDSRCIIQCCEDACALGLHLRNHRQPMLFLVGIGI